MSMTHLIRILIGFHMAYSRGQSWCPWHQVARKEQVGHPRSCSKNNISMINVFTLMNIINYTEIIKGK